MGIGSVNGSESSLLVNAGRSSDDASSIDTAEFNGLRFNGSDEGRPAEPSRSMLRKFQEAIGSTYDKGKAGFSNFKANVRNAFTSMPQMFGRSQNTANILNRAELNRTDAIMNGLNQADIDANVAFIDDITVGAKLPESVKVPLAHSPTAMAHLQIFKDAGYSLSIDDDTIWSTIDFQRSGDKHISLPGPEMSQDPKAFVSKFANELLSREGDVLHGTGAALRKAVPYKDREGAALEILHFADPFGPKLNDQDRADIKVARAFEDKIAKTEMPKLQQELAEITENYEYMDFRSEPVLADGPALY